MRRPYPPAIRTITLVLPLLAALLSMAWPSVWAEDPPLAAYKHLLIEAVQARFQQRKDIAEVFSSEHAKEMEQQIRQALDPCSELEQDARVIILLSNRRWAHTLPSLQPLFLAASKDPDPLIHSLALAMLTAGAEDLDLVLRRLDQDLRDDHEAVRWAATVILSALAGRVGECRAPLLMATTDSSSAVRAAAVTGLAKLRPPTESTVTVIMQLLEDGESSVRVSAASALGELGPAASASVPALLELSRDPDPALRSAVLRAGARIGWPESHAASLLLAALQENDAETREAATTGLQQQEQVAGDLVPELIPYLFSEEAGARVAAAKVLAAAGSAGAPALPHLARLLETCQPIDPGTYKLEWHWEEPTPCGTAVRYQAVRALGILLAAAPVAKGNSQEDGEQSQQALMQQNATTMLVKLLADPDWEVQRSAAEGLGRLLPGSTEAMDALVEGLDDEEQSDFIQEVLLRSKPSFRIAKALASLLDECGAEARTRALVILSGMGQEAAPARAQLSQALHAGRVVDRRLAAMALGSLGYCSVEEQQRLVETTADDDAMVRLAATESLGRCGSENRQVITALRRRVKDRHWEVRAAALDTALLLAPEQMAASCAGRIADPVVQVRRRAAACLAASAVAGEQVTKALLQAARDEDATVRLFVAKRLASLPDSATEPVLRELAADDSPGVRRAATGSSSERSLKLD